MKSSLKKWIIVVVVFVVVAVAALLSVSLLTNISTTTVKDIRILYAESQEEVFDKDVFLTAEDENYFDITIEASASTILRYSLKSTNTDVATVTNVGNNYRITYHKVGSATIVATTVEPSDIKDSFVIDVKEYVPTSFKIIDEKAIDDYEVGIYADNRDYCFSFEANRGNIDENINISSLYVIDDYDRDVFNTIYIDENTSELVINAKQSSLNDRKYITIQSTRVNESGNKETVGTFVVCVNIYGNYISDIQLMLSSVPNFESSPYIFGEGLLNEGETRIEKIYLTKDIHMIYLKARTVYTNGEMFDVTAKATSSKIYGDPEITRPALGGYYSMDLKNQDAGIKFSYSSKEIVVSFGYIDELTTPTTYLEFVNQQLYKKIIDHGKNITYFEYIYWDVRFKRTDTITDSEGRIIGFVSGAPDCSEQEISTQTPEGDN